MEGGGCRRGGSVNQIFIFYLSDMCHGGARRDYITMRGPQSSPPGVRDICLINKLGGLEAGTQQTALKASVTLSGHRA